MSLNFLLKGQLKFLNQYYEVTAISGENDDLRDVRTREVVRTLNISFERPISPLRDLVSLYKLWVCLKKEKPTIVHSITPKAGLITMLAGKMASVPIRIHTFTGLIFPSKTGVMKVLLIMMDRLLCWSATHVYPEGNGVKNDLIAYKITRKPLKVIANGNVNGIDTSYYSKDNFSEMTLSQIRTSLGIDDSDFVFVFVGRLVGDKGINELVKAFSTFKTTSFKNYDLSSIKLILVGGTEKNLDPLFLETTALIESNPNIISVGFQIDVRSFYGISNALVFPSYREGFPNVVLQAGAMELPSIVTDINGSNEIIINGENGIIIPKEDVEALQSAMIELVENKSYYDSLKKQSRSLITSRYEQEVVWNAILQEYQNLEKNV